MDNALDIIRSWDYHAYQFLHGAIHGRNWLNESYLFFAKYGIVFFFLSFTYLITRKKINAFICTFVSMSLATSFDLLITFFWKRPRPFISHSSEVMTPVISGLRVDLTSFPSGHTYISFAIATSVYLYGHKRLGTALFALAVLVAVGRIGAGLHYPSDVIGGAMLGIASGIAGYLITSSKHKIWNS